MPAYMVLSKSGFVKPCLQRRDFLERRLALLVHLVRGLNVRKPFNELLSRQTTLISRPSESSV